MITYGALRLTLPTAPPIVHAVRRHRAERQQK
jgi:hypothetical protein